MANTYTQIHLQVVMVVKYRHALISKSWKNELYMYMTGIIQSYDHKVLAINGMPDHVHILIGYRPSQSLPDLMQILKKDSSRWINEKRFTPIRFRWQPGYGAFSYCKYHVPKIIAYIRNQEQHHATRTLRKEYIRMLERHEVDFEERFIFKDPE